MGRQADTQAQGFPREDTSVQTPLDSWLGTVITPCALDRGALTLQQGHSPGTPAPLTLSPPTSWESEGLSLRRGQASPSLRLSRTGLPISTQELASCTASKCGGVCDQMSLNQPAFKALQDVPKGT